uniref:NADH-cytochrome b5 reductase n=1 Tax=Guillardia theta TaxID=55529 RepID=A0A7S4KHQ6_GUITH
MGRGDDVGGAMQVAVAVGVVAVGAVYWLMKGSKGSRKERKIFLDKSKKQSVPLTEKIQLSHDTFLYRFSLPTPDHVLGLPVGKHFKIFGKIPTPKVKNEWNGKEDSEQIDPSHDGLVERKYTPTSSDEEVGYFDLVIKVYRQGHTYNPPRDKFPDGGKISRYIDSLKIGDMLEIQGPFGHIEYLGKGVFKSFAKELEAVKEIGMVAGGTGITPMLQIINAVLRDKSDTTKIRLLFANQTKEDILLMDKLEELREANKSQVKIYYTLDNPPKNWKGFTGFVNEGIRSSHNASSPT